MLGEGDRGVRIPRGETGVSEELGEGGVGVPEELGERGVVSEELGEGGVEGQGCSRITRGGGRGTGPQ